MSGAARISPTAHYTGHVWARNGLSHPALDTREGRLLYESLRGPMSLSRALGGNSLERYLLARHQAIDGRLEHAIAAGQVAQVIEIAAGLSPRGWRFTERYGAELTYLEADLPGMAERKRAALREIGHGPRVVDLDVLAGGGLEALAAELDPARGTAIISEGLLGYLDTRTVIALWRRVAAVLHGFPEGRYLSDLHLAAEQDLPIRAFRMLLSAFVRGGVHLHFADEPAALEALRAAGFDEAALPTAAQAGGAAPMGGGQLVHIIEASTNANGKKAL